jgi:glycosyltransferase involved in cell wall biosynthesis
MNPPSERDLVCLSHLRWDFVYQRPQHLMTRHAKRRRVFFVEEPHFNGESRPRLQVTQGPDQVRVAVPHLPKDLSPGEVAGAQRALIDQLLEREGVARPILWYYTPLALPFTDHVDAGLIVYDCMDELSAFRGASPQLLTEEERLMERADVVFTGGWSLYEAKRARHPNVHGLPSSVDVAHFRRARLELPDPADQSDLERPRLGFFGVIDERMDLELLAGVADLRPNWQLVLVGPVVKIDPNELPRRPNIHYLGAKSYQELPAYLAHWDVALMPFARNEATRFISPTKTPEYLAAGRPVVSTSIRDVIRPYGERGLVRIADTPGAFVAAAQAAMAEDALNDSWLARVDAFLADTSWDRTWARTDRTMTELLQRRLRHSGPH